VATFELVARVDAHRSLVRIVGGEHDQMVVVVCQSDDSRLRHLSWFLEDSEPDVALLSQPDVGTATAIATGQAEAVAEATACELLESLLSPRQLGDWRKRRRFWVTSPMGSVELGQIYHLKFRGPTGIELVLCVVPEGFRDLPQPDVWTNLLLKMRSDPDEFFRVANWRRPNQERWHRGPVPKVLRS